MSPALDLSGADTSQPDFIALPSGSYPAAIWEAEWRETKNEGKLPMGTPMLNVQFKIDEDAMPDNPAPYKDADGNDVQPVYGGRVFRSFLLPQDKKYEHKAKMEGMFVRFLQAIGYDPEEVQTKGFEVDLEDLAGRECTLVLSKEQYPSNELDDNGERIVKWKNEVKAVKPAGASVSRSSSSLI